MRKSRFSAIVVSVCMLLLGAMPPLAHSATQNGAPLCEEGWASLPSAAYPGVPRLARWSNDE